MADCEGDGYECEICGEIFDTKHGRNVHCGCSHSNEELKELYLGELQRLADELGRTPTARDMDKFGKHSSGSYKNKFGSWNNALEECGLEIIIERNMSKEKLLSELQRLADELGRTPTQRDMNKFGKHSNETYRNKFGSWNNALEECGLEIIIERNMSKEKLLSELQRLADELGRTPTQRDMNKFGKHSYDSYHNKFGSWNNALEECGLELNRVRNGEGEYIYYGSNWDEQRQKALQRDDHVCCVCGVTEEEHLHQNSSGLDVHHITPLRSFADEGGDIEYEQANRLDNLVTLCHDCHTEYGDRGSCNPKYTDFTAEEFVFLAEMSQTVSGSSVAASD